jgi:ABC transporter
LIGANDGTGTFTIPRKPFRRRVKGLPRFVTTRAGEYCFIPGIRTLRWIAEGQWRGPAYYRTKSDPVRLEEDAGFLPRRDGTGQSRCYGAARDLARPAERNDMLELKGLTRRYGDLVALDDLSFTVAEDQMFGFVGSNGAGKTTAMRIILGVLAPDAGEVRWRGQPMNDEIRKHIGYLPGDHGQTFLKQFAAHRIEPADRGDGRWRDVPRTCRVTCAPAAPGPKPARHRPGWWRAGPPGLELRRRAQAWKHGFLFEGRLSPVLRSLVDADMAPTAGGVRLAVPAPPSFTQPETGDASHEVELGRVGQAQPDRAEDEPVGADADVVLVEDLRHGVVPADVQHDVVDPDVLGVDVLVARP